MRRAQTRGNRGKLTGMAGKKRKAAPARLSKRARERTHSEDGVDLTLIRWFISLTPEERLLILQENVRNKALMLEGYRVPDFPCLVTVKAETARERDLKVLAFLKRTLEEKSRK